MNGNDDPFGGGVDRGLRFVQLAARDLGGLYEPDDRFELEWTQLRPDWGKADGGEYYQIEVAAGIVGARLYTNRRTGFTGQWRDAPNLDSAVRIQMIEVAAEYRGRGLGTWILTQLQNRHPNTRLLALSHHAAVGFWDRTGWSRFEHATDRHHQLLYVSPVTTAPQ